MAIYDADDIEALGRHGTKDQIIDRLVERAKSLGQMVRSQVEREELTKKAFGPLVDSWNLPRLRDEQQERYYQRECPRTQHGLGRQRDGRERDRCELVAKISTLEHEVEELQQRPATIEEGSRKTLEDMQNRFERQQKQYTQVVAEKSKTDDAEREVQERYHESQQRLEDRQDEQRLLQRKHRQCKISLMTLMNATIMYYCHTQFDAEDFPQVLSKLDGRLLNLQTEISERADAYSPNSHAFSVHSDCSLDNGVWSLYQQMASDLAIFTHAQAFERQKDRFKGVWEKHRRIDMEKQRMDPDHTSS